MKRPNRMTEEQSKVRAQILFAITTTLDTVGVMQLANKVNMTPEQFARHLYNGTKWVFTDAETQRLIDELKVTRRTA